MAFRASPRRSRDSRTCRPNAARNSVSSGVGWGGNGWTLRDDVDIKGIQHSRTRYCGNILQVDDRRQALWIVPPLGSIDALERGHWPSDPRLAGGMLALHGSGHDLSLLDASRRCMILNCMPLPNTASEESTMLALSTADHREPAADRHSARLQRGARPDRAQSRRRARRQDRLHRRCAARTRTASSPSASNRCAGALTGLGLAAGRARAALSPRHDRFPGRVPRRDQGRHRADRGEHAAHDRRLRLHAARQPRARARRVRAAAARVRAARSASIRTLRT